MKKLKIFGISNREKHSYFLLEKKQAFVSLFRKFLENLGFEEMYVCHTLVTMYKDKHDVDVKLSKLSEYYEHVGNANYDIDLFIGKRIHLIINTAQKNRPKFVDELMKFCEFYKYKFKKKKSGRKTKRR
jgi:hypothetical protein